jgi:hypothetical protein
MWTNWHKWVSGPAMVMVGLLFVGGCQSAQEPVDEAARPQPETVTEEPWRPEPVGLRVHPATRFATKNGQPILEAAVELFDALGDSIKAPGRVRLELFARGQTSRPGERLSSWDISLRRQGDQRQYFDLVTRTYVLRLEVDEAEVIDHPTLLRVTFVCPSGQQLEAERPLPVDW